MLLNLARSLILTLLLELSFALVWGLRKKRELLFVSLANCLTNPAVVLLHHAALGLGLWDIPSTALLELAAVLVEWRCYQGELKRPFLFSLFANAFSFGVGCVLNYFI